VESRRASARIAFAASWLLGGLDLVKSPEQVPRDQRVSQKRFWRGGRGNMDSALLQHHGAD
jgi:hypothetical protein